MGKLLILGNGFDIKCGLKSSFKNYMGYIKDPNEFEKRHIKKIKILTDKIKFLTEIINNTYSNVYELRSEFNNIMNNIPSKSEGTFIESLLCFNHLNQLENWADVEATIKYFLDSKNLDSAKLRLIGLEHYIELFKTEFKNIEDYIYGKDFLNVLFEFLHAKADRSELEKEDITYAFLLIISVKMGFEINVKNFRKNFLNFFKTDLNKFEARFSSYIGFDESSHCEVIPKNRMIPIDQNTYNHRTYVISESLNASYSSVLCFNYTYPYLSGINIKNVRHIHGNVNIDERTKEYIRVGDNFTNGNNIIIGIDNVNLEHEDLYQFTKTYRIMENIDPNASNYLHVLNKGVDEVVFYGHSLGEADYSYFQSIFDYLDIYNKNVTLIFSYSLHDDKSPNEIKISQCEKIFALINKYGETLDNKSKGNNLLHKMLLENRIHLKEIE